MSSSIVNGTQPKIERFSLGNLPTCTDLPRLAGRHLHRQFLASEAKEHFVVIDNDESGIDGAVRAALSCMPWLSQHV